MTTMSKFDQLEIKFVLHEAKLRMENAVGVLDVASALIGAGRCFPSTPCAAAHLADQLSVKALYSTDPSTIDMLRKHPGVQEILNESSLC